eukprot:1889283-Pleurochrysis_carterae.AAC.1
MTTLSSIGFGDIRANSDVEKLVVRDARVRDCACSNARTRTPTPTRCKRSPRTLHATDTLRLQPRVCEHAHRDSKRRCRWRLWPRAVGGHDAPGLDRPRLHLGANRRSHLRH